MKKILLISHGAFAQGLRDAALMLGGSEDSLFAYGLSQTEDIESFNKRIEEFFSSVNSDDELIVLCDLQSGSPCTAARIVLNRRTDIKRTLFFAGMNLAAVLAACTSISMEEAESEIPQEATLSVCRIEMPTAAKDEEI